MDIKELRSYIIEFLGTFLLVIITSMSLAAFNSEKINLLGLALINGLSFAVIIWAGAKTSGAHYNPVLSLSLLLARNTTFRKAAIFIILQLFASIFASLVVVLIVPFELKQNEQILFYPKPGKSIEPYQVFIFEFLFSFWYLGAYMQSVQCKAAPSNVFGFIIGSVISIAHLVLQTLSGGCVNPIRVFGPALISQEFNIVILYMGSQLAGGLLASFYFDFFMIKKEKISPRKIEVNN